MERCLVEHWGFLVCTRFVIVTGDVDIHGSSIPSTLLSPLFMNTPTLRHSLFFFSNSSFPSLSMCRHHLITIFLETNRPLPIDNCKTGDSSTCATTNSNDNLSTIISIREQCTRRSAKSSGWRGGSERPISVWKGTARWLVVSVFLF